MSGGKQDVVSDLSPIRLLICDDHPFTREGVVNACRWRPDTEVVGEANDGTAAIEQARKTEPDVVVMDLEMPGTNGLETIARIRNEHENVRILVLSAHLEESYIYGAMEEGADGYLMKGSPMEEFFDAVHQVANGKPYASPELGSVLFGITQSSPGAGLEKTELEILRLLAEGKMEAQVAAAVHKSPRTIRYRKERICAKLGVKNFDHAVSIAIQRGLVRVRDPRNE